MRLSSGWLHQWIGLCFFSLFGGGVIQFVFTAATLAPASFLFSTLILAVTFLLGLYFLKGGWTRREGALLFLPLFGAGLIQIIFNLSSLTLLAFLPALIILVGSFLIGFFFLSHRWAFTEGGALVVALSTGFYYWQSQVPEGLESSPVIFFIVLSLMALILCVFLLILSDA